MLTVRARAAYGVCHLFVREGEFLDQPLQGARLIRGVELLTLDILDERDRQRLLIVEFANDRWNLRESGELSSPESALARDHFELVRETGYRPNDERLNEAGGFN